MPESEKLEDVLKLGLSATQDELARSTDLATGYDMENRTWELIVKYHGDIMKAEQNGLTVVILGAGYAIANVPESMIGWFAALDEVEYIEKPKSLYYSYADSRISSCVLPVTDRSPFLTGKGCVVAVIDSGIDYMNADFCNPDGTTRIISIWDQTVPPNPDKGFMPPAGFIMGTEFDYAAINAALAETDFIKRFEMLPSQDITGHGTAVAGVAAGNGNNSGGLYKGIAPESELLIVKLGMPSKEGFPRTTEMMRALAYVSRKCSDMSVPFVINLSFGNSYGSHDGDSILERFVDSIAEVGKSVICVGSGNEGSSGGHVSGNINTDREIELSVSQYEMGLNLSVWKNFLDTFNIRITSPGRQSADINTERIGTLRVTLEDTELLIYVGTTSPYSRRQEIFIDFLPKQTYINAGIWSFTFEPVHIVEGGYRLYLPSSQARGINTEFYEHTPQVTMTIPSTASRVITVGAYDTVYGAYAEFSGRGYNYGTARPTDARMLIKPEIVAPGVDVVSVAAGGQYGGFTGTSFASPCVAGAAALLMEWGIVRGNDPYLYGEKVKSYLIKGAMPLSRTETYPNAQVGYGALCVEASLP